MLFAVIWLCCLSTWAEYCYALDQAPAAGKDRPLSGEDLKRQNAEIARLSEQIRAIEARLRETPKRKFISASIQQPEYRAYLARWSKQIERAGEQHFQNEAKRVGLSGSVIVSVSIARDGQLLDTQIVKSSGSVLLDDLAVSVTKLASPFEPIPELDNIDILSITRTWKFD